MRRTLSHVVQLALLMSVCLAFSATDVHAQSSPRPRQGSEQQVERIAPAVQQRAESPATSPSEPRTGESGDDKQTYDATSSGIMTLPAWLTAGASLASALFALVLAIVNWLLWQETRRTAQAAQKSAETAIETGAAYKRAERAWIGMAEVNARKIVNLEKQIVEGFIFSFCWRNAGRSPALRAQAMANSELIPTGAVLDMNTVKRKEDPHRGGSMVPGAENFGPPRFVSLADMIDVAEGRKQLILWGLITYFTAFDDLGERETEEAVSVGLAHGDRNTLSAPVLIADQFSYRSYGPNNHAT